MKLIKFLIITVFINAHVCNVLAQDVDEPSDLSSNSEAEFFYYKQVVSLPLIVNTPNDWSESDLRPVILFFHGSGSSTEQFEHQAHYFVNKGFVCVRVRHRLCNSFNNPTDGHRDARTAVRWVRKYAGKLGVDTSKLIVSGGSAGGAVSIATFQNTYGNHPTDDLQYDSKPAMMILFNPSVSGFSYSGLEINHPPTIIFHGSADITVPLTSVERYVREIKETTQNDIELVVYEGRTHGFFNYSKGTEDYNNTLARADTFLVNHGLFYLPTGINDIANEGESSKITIGQNFPNPFKSNTNIKFSIPKPTQVLIKVVSIDGKLVKIIKDSYLPAGIYNTYWDGRDSSQKIVDTGMYLCNLQINNTLSVIKMHFIAKY